MKLWIAQNVEKKQQKCIISKSNFFALPQLLPPRKTQNTDNGLWQMRFATKQTFKDAHIKKTVVIVV